MLLEGCLDVAPATARRLVLLGLGDSVSQPRSSSHRYGTGQEGEGSCVTRHTECQCTCMYRLDPEKGMCGVVSKIVGRPGLMCYGGLHVV